MRRHSPPGPRPRPGARAARFLLGVFAPADPFERDGATAVDLDQAFRQALSKLDSDFAPESLLALDLNREFGNILGKRGEVDAAAQRLDASLALARQGYDSASDPHVTCPGFPVCVGRSSMRPLSPLLRPTARPGPHARRAKAASSRR
jgi:hypothetical protein